MINESGVAVDDAPLALLADGYRSYLDRIGFSPRTVRERLELFGQLTGWLSGRGLSLTELTAAEAQRFFSAERAAGRRRVPTLHSLVELFDYLRAEQVLVVEQCTPSPIEDLLDRYGHFLAHDRGLAPLTVVRYQRMARRFLAHRALRNGGVTGAEGLDAAEVHAYLLESCSHLVIESAKREAADLRSLLHFLYLQGFSITDLALAMPPVAGWRDTRLPATMSAAQVTAILDGCDRSRASGLRDLAILSLLARLGLRSGEVAALQLRDIDWRTGEIWVRGKARRHQTRLPLTIDVGQAIVDYLRHGRPSSPCPNVILTSYAPFRGIHPSSLTRVVYRACQRAGLAPVGGHRLRHALATELLRQGGNLLEISQVLRHRDLATTSVYAKLDQAALRTVARPWPGVRP